MGLTQYQTLTKQVVAIIESEPNLIANLSNISALLNMELEDVNWVGFYLMEGNELVLGPFQGKVACVRIPMGQGVCGTAAKTNTVQRIDNVHEFEGHIACDAESLSELVVPFSMAGQIIGVLDIDSPTLSRFDGNDQQGLTNLMAKVEKVLNSHANEV